MSEHEHEIIERLETAVRLADDDAAIRISAEYEPLAGSDAKVFPPSYLGPSYHFEERWDEQGQSPVRVPGAVIVHELLHPLVPNHGPVFQSLLGAYCPNRRSITGIRAVCGSLR